MLTIEKVCRLRRCVTMGLFMILIKPRRVLAALLAKRTNGSIIIGFELGLVFGLIHLEFDEPTYSVKLTLQIGHWSHITNDGPLYKREIEGPAILRDQLNYEFPRRKEIPSPAPYLANRGSPGIFNRSIHSRNPSTFRKE